MTTYKMFFPKNEENMLKTNLTGTVCENVK
jgi:hypothetical protein